MHYLGAASIAMLWLTIAYILTKWPIDRRLTISRHVARHRQSFVLFAIVSTLGLVLFYIFSQAWLVPTYQLPPSFLRLLFLVTALQIGASLTPDSSRPDAITKLHTFCAYLAAMLLPALIAYIALAPGVSPTLRAVAWTSDLLMLACFGVLALRVKLLIDNYLISQAAYIALFHIVILTATFLG